MPNENELDPSIVDRRLNRSKPYGMIHGRPEGCPGAAFQQNGIYFDQQGMPVGGKYVAVDTSDVIKDKDAELARLKAELAKLKGESNDSPDDDIPSELDRQELMLACKEKGIKVNGNMRPETLYKLLQENADAA